jgi:hypothetical protein
MENVGTFYGHLVCFMAVWVYIFPFWYVESRKIWQSWRRTRVEARDRFLCNLAPGGEHCRLEQG